jgi:hypothetical protein
VHDFALSADRAWVSLLCRAEEWTMELGRMSLPLTIAGLATLAIAATLIWLLLYEPVALAGAVNDGDITLVAQAIGSALVKTLAALVRYL